VDNGSGAQRHALILKLVICQVACESLTRTINSPHTDARAREASMQRLNQLKRELQELRTSLQLLRDEPAN
jgi:cell division protein FtsB